MLILENISKSYFITEEKINILKSISLYFGDNGFVGIKGESGAGKSTLLNIISSLEKPDSGLIFYDGEIINEMFLKREVSIISQNNDLVSFLNVKDNIMLGSKIAEKKINKKEMNKLINRLELEDHLYKLPYQLSGGQKKRVSIARALLKKSSILLCDEPTGALHNNQAKEVMTILREISKDRLVIIVSHDDKLLEEYCDDILVLENGKISNKKLNYISKEKKNEECKKHSFLFYILKQIISQKYYLFFLTLFEIIIIVLLFLMLTAINGIEYSLNNNYEHSVQKNMITVEKFDSSPFTDLLSIPCEYDYILSLGELSLESDMKFLPKSMEHIQMEEGRLPINNQEVIVSYALKNKLDTQISFKYNNHDISLKVVGVISKDFFNEECVYFTDDFRVLIPDYINKNMIIVESSQIQEVYDELKEEYIVFSDSIEQRNNYLSLITIGKVIGYIFFSISFICSFFLFYLTYQTLGMKRSHDYALLLMMGLNRSKLFSLCIIEALLIGSILSFMGILFCILIYYYLNDVIVLESIFMFSLRLNPCYIIIITILYLSLSLLSSYLPAKKIVNHQLVSLLREE